tara:strand:+ start:1309 stop:1590 length:282 start_codon:yes stop_codon:yes gene_type:complete
LSRAKLIKQLKEKNPKLNQSQINSTIDIFCTSITNALRNNKSVELRGFGTFSVKKIKEKYSARNPRTGELIYIPEKNKLRFKPSKNFNTKINE